MAQIVVRNIEEDVMEGLKALAARRGVSTEQAVRSLMADAVDAERRRASFREAAASTRDGLRRTHGELSDSQSLIRADRDR
jgi:plasmid stability protein